MQGTQRFKLLMLLISTSFLGTPSFGQQPPIMCPLPQSDTPVSLQETLEKAYMQNADLDAARAGLRVTDENVSIANADWRPSLSVLGQQQQTQSYPIGEHRLAHRAHNSNSQYVVTLAQNIFHGGLTEANIAVAESQVLAGKAGLFGTEQNTLFTAVQAHTNILAAEAIVDYKKESAEDYRKIWERAQARFEVGEGSRVDAETAKGQYEGAKADLSIAYGNLETAKATYLQQVGSPAGNLSPAKVMKDLPQCVEDARQIAQISNPAIIQSRYQLEAAEYNVNVQIAGLLPVVNVEGQAGNQRQGGTGTLGHPKRTNLAFNAVIDIPLYNQGVPSAKIRQAYQSVAQSKVQLVSAQRQVEQSVTAAWDNLIAARESVKGYLAQVKAQELAVQGALEEVNVGLKSIIDVLVIQGDLITAQVNLATAQKGLIDAGYQVLQAMGKLTACDLKLRVKYYDPDSYYNAYKDAWIQFWQGEDLRYVKGK